MSTRLDWKGDHVRAELEDATLGGMNEITDRCVKDAKSNHPFANRTGTAEASIQQKPAKASASKISARWGSYGGRKIRYFFYLEYGTAKMQPYPTLRPAADRNYPHLVGEIKKRTHVN